MRAALVPATITVLCFVVFLVSFLRDRRRFRNGIYLFFTLAFLALTLIFLLASVSGVAAAVVVFATLALIPLSILALAVFLICNGITMIRREGRRLANLLSLLTGVGIVAFIAFNVALSRIDWPPLRIILGSLNEILAYASFLFVCFLLYAIVYGRIRPRRPVDFIVVLGAGLLTGSRVSPLLASRLDRGRQVLKEENSRSRQPLLLTSGGQGPDEMLPESHAMAEYLVAAGVPQEQILVEDRSRTTFENLTFSAQIMRERRPDYRCVVVTNNFHVLRAALIARKAKVNGQVIGSPTAWYFWPSATIREFVAVFMEHRIVNFTICGLMVLSQILRVV